MDTYVILKDLAIIIVFAKLFGILARKCKAPQVVGELIAGIVLGPSVLGLVQQSDFLAQMAEIGVILLMFSAGLGTSLKDLLRTGVKSLLIACAGVFVPLVLGAILYMSFYGFSAVGTEEFYHAVFIGVILTATSVSITVQALKELGKLKTEVGTTILNAAIIDDVIGIIVLTVVIGFKDPTSNPLKVAASTILFFALAIVLGFLCFKLFNRMNSVFPHTRRLPILGLALCFGLSYISEKYFGIADITGAYVAGVILCSLDSSDYIEEKMDMLRRKIKDGALGADDARRALRAEIDGELRKAPADVDMDAVNACEVCELLHCTRKPCLCSRKPVVAQYELAVRDDNALHLAPCGGARIRRHGDGLGAFGQRPHQAA